MLVYIVNVDLSRRSFIWFVSVSKSRNYCKWKALQEVHFVLFLEVMMTRFCVLPWANKHYSSTSLPCSDHKVMNRSLEYILVLCHFSPLVEHLHLEATIWIQKNGIKANSYFYLTVYSLDFIIWCSQGQCFSSLNVLANKTWGTIRDLNILMAALCSVSSHLQNFNLYCTILNLLLISVHFFFFSPGHFEQTQETLSDIHQRQWIMINGIVAF